MEQSKNKKRLFHKLATKVYFETLVLAMHCYCEDNVKYRSLSKHLFQIKQQYGGWKNFKVMTNFCKK